MRQSLSQYQRVVILLLAMVSLAGVKAYSQRIAVIANASVPVTSANSKLVLAIYSMNMQFWGDETRIYPVTLQGNDRLVQKFHAYLGRTPLELRKIWMRIQLSGEGRPPIVVSSETEVGERVVSTPGAIGFVSADKVPNGAKVLAWIDDRP